jgi:hypothetical protein
VRNPGLYNWIIESPPPSLIVYAATALHHALRECQNNNGVTTARTVGVKQPPWMYSFNMTNDGSKLALDTRGTVLTTFQVVYTKLMNTWNALPAAYQDKVIITITAEMRKHLIDAKPVNGTPPVLDDTSAEKIDAEMMLALIAEPLPVVPPYQQMQIPLAVDKNLIDTEDGIHPDDATRADTSGASLGGYGSDEIREGTEGEDVVEDEESGDEGQDEESGDAEQDEESGDESDT